MTVKLLAKAPAMSGLLTLKDITNIKRLVGNCRRNTEANNGTYQSLRPLLHGSDERRLCSGTRSEDSQPNHLLFLGMGALASVK